MKNGNAPAHPLSHTHRHTKINKALFLLITLPAFETFPEGSECPRKGRSLRPGLYKSNLLRALKSHRKDLAFQATFLWWLLLLGKSWPHLQGFQTQTLALVCCPCLDPFHPYHSWGSQQFPFWSCWGINSDPAGFGSFQENPCSFR